MSWELHIVDMAQRFGMAPSAVADTFTMEDYLLVEQYNLYSAWKRSK